MLRQKKFYPSSLVNCTALIAFFLVNASPAQRVGGHFTAGFNNARTSFNAELDGLDLPLVQTDEVMLEGISDAQNLLVFDGYLLVGESGSGGVTYRLFERSTGRLLWTWDTMAVAERLDFVPASAQDVVLLGGTEEGIVAVRISDRVELWRDTTVGSTSGRYPVLTGDLALYHGEDAVVAADAHTGKPIWRANLNTIEAPLTQFGDRVYVLAEDLSVRAFNLLDGTEIWESDSKLPGHCPCSLVATEPSVFASSNLSLSSGRLTSFASDAGKLQWQVFGVPLSTPLSVILARGRLISVGGNEVQGTFIAVDPDSGEGAFERNESGGLGAIAVEPSASTFHFALSAGDTFCYYNLGQNRIQFREISSGQLVWSIELPQGAELREGDELRALSAAGNALYALLKDRVLVFRPSFERFLPHFASGQGQSTMVALANGSANTVRGRVELFNSQGAVLPIGVSGTSEGDDLAFEVPGGSSSFLQIENTLQLQTGWIRLSADGPLRVTSVFRAEPESEGQLSEAGIADENPVTDARIPVQLQTNLNTAVAIANPLKSPVVVRLVLSGTDFETTGQFELPGMGHIARFANEFFTSTTGDSFEGTLVIKADSPVVITAIRTQNGLQLSSLPVAD